MLSCSYNVAITKTRQADQDIIIVIGNPSKNQKLVGDEENNIRPPLH